jgi:hypothetical protein
MLSKKQGVIFKLKNLTLFNFESEVCPQFNQLIWYHVVFLNFFFLHQNEKKSNKKLSSASSLSNATTTTVSIKDSLIENKEKLNDLNDQILNSQQLRTESNFQHPVQRSNSSETERRFSMDLRFNPSQNKSESIMSSDSDLRFTRKKLGDNQRCGCIVVAGFLIMLLIAGLTFYAGCK